MSYQVLARKWRPKSFREMAGQNHVLKALINALDHDRLHHAYLFTGTRGVGKTTIARILAKCLNCETGVSSEPCGQCQSCVAINEGRFVDLIEVDAASRTKVEDTRELLDNVQYTPSQGRYKVYLIDEVHMLSSSSFNALLKTLEEPPPHVKFLLATTDPQKIPPTILSRCLQFSLKNLSPEKVVEYLKIVLEKEMIQYDDGALWLLGRAADGSMRDALSLTDQGIAFGSGKLSESEIRQMLGTIDHDAVYRLIAALNDRSAPLVLQIIADTLELGVDPAGVVDELLSVLHRLALAQLVPDGIDNSLGDKQRLLDLAGSLPAEDVQFFYQMALAGRRDFGLSPDPRAALEMLLLRMLAFMPAGVAHPPQRALPGDQLAAEAAASAKKPEPNRREAMVSQSPNQGMSSQSMSSQSISNQDISDQGSDEPAPVSQVASPAQTAAPEQTAPAPQASTPSPASSAQTSASLASTSEPSVELGSSSDELPPWEEYNSSSHHVATPPLSGADAARQALSATITTETKEEEQGAFEPDVPPLGELYQQHSASKPDSIARPSAAPPQTESLAESMKAPPAAPMEAVAPSSSSDEVYTSPLSWDELNTTSWREQFSRFKLPGMLGSVASHCQIQSLGEGHINFCIHQSNAALLNSRHIERLAESLSTYFERQIQVKIDIGEVAEETPAAYRQRQLEQRLHETTQAILGDPVVQQLMTDFNAELEDGSVKLGEYQEKRGR